MVAQPTQDETSIEHEIALEYTSIDGVQWFDEFCVLVDTNRQAIASAMEGI